jgi:hypothetical protein
VQLSGTAAWLFSAQFHATADRSQVIHDLIVRFNDLLLVQVQQSVACNALHALEARLCRWLLQAHDCVDSDTIPLTQEFLGQMLGVRRTTVTSRPGCCKAPASYATAAVTSKSWIGRQSKTYPVSATPSSGTSRIRCSRLRPCRPIRGALHLQQEPVEVCQIRGFMPRRRKRLLLNQAIQRKTNSENQNHKQKYCIDVHVAPDVSVLWQKPPDGSVFDPLSKALVILSHLQDRVSGF